MEVDRRIGSDQFLKVIVWSLRRVPLVFVKMGMMSGMAIGEYGVRIFKVWSLGRWMVQKSNDLFNSWMEIS